MTSVNGSATGTTNGKAVEVARHRNGTFAKGHPGFGGRKPGSRNRLSESFLADLHTEWKRSGKKVLQRVAAEAPETFMRVVASVMPRLLEIEGAVHVQSDLAIEIRDFKAAYEMIGANRMPLIDAEAVEQETFEPDDERTE